MTAIILLAACWSPGASVLGRARPSDAEVSYCYGGKPADYGPRLHFLVLKFETEKAAASWAERVLDPVIAPNQPRTFSEVSRERCAWPKSMSVADLIGSRVGALDRVYGRLEGREIWIEGWEEE